MWFVYDIENDFELFPNYELANKEFRARYNCFNAELYEDNIYKDVGCTEEHQGLKSLIMGQVTQGVKSIPVEKRITVYKYEVE